MNRAREIGNYLGEKLRALKPKHASIGEVRGLGLFWALEMVKDQATKTPFNTKQDKVDGKVTVVDRVAADMMKRGVSLQAWISHFVIAPPLIIEKEQIDVAVEHLDQSLAIADAAIAEIMREYEKKTGHVPEAISGSSPGAWEVGTVLIS